MVDSGGLSRSMNGMSLNPITETSSGQLQAKLVERAVAADREHVVGRDDRGQVAVRPPSSSRGSSGRPPRPSRLGGVDDLVLG